MTTQPSEWNPQAAPKPSPPRSNHLRVVRPNIDTRIEKGCRTKTRYATFAEAADIGMARMATECGTPLYIYPCPYCPGYHLTSTDKWKGSTPVPSMLTTGRLAVEIVNRQAAPGVARGERRRGEKKWRTERARRRNRVRKNYEAAEQRIDVVLPRPKVATPQEVEAFFARHSPSTSRSSAAPS